MRLGFGEDQIALRDGVRAVLDARGGPAVVRAAASGDLATAGDLWQRLADVGLLGALVPQRCGGLGLDLVDVVLCLEETGRAAVPLPVVETAVVASELLAGGPQADRLPGLGGGDLRVSATLERSDLMPWLPFAGAVLVLDGGEAHLVEAADCAVEPVTAVDPARPLARVTARCRPSSLVTGDARRVERARRAGTLATAAQLLGLCDRMLAMTVVHVRSRQQFGVPVGSFQAVKHRLADALAALEFARPLVYAAAWAHARDEPGAERDVAAAKLRAGAAAGEVARSALQCHGAMGYTQEYDLHLWLKRTWALQAAWGRQEELRDAVAHALDI